MYNIFEIEPVICLISLQIILLPILIFIFPLFLGMVMKANEFEAMEV